MNAGMPAMNVSIEDCIIRLESDGLLVKSDPRFPSVATLVAREPVQGSWWAHPASHAIFQAIQDLTARSDVLLVKLVSGKDTFVHKRLWPELLAIATANQPWQVDGLPGDARALYKRVLAGGEVEATGSSARLLESRLLVRGEQFHSETGNHKKRLESWSRWAERAGLAGCELPAVRAAKGAFERVYPGAKWPWTSTSGRSRGTINHPAS